MKRAIAILLLAAFMPSALTAKPNPQRMEAIWRAAYLRLEKQSDYWFDAGDFPRIINSLRLMAHVYPDDYETATNLGWLLESTEAWDEALAVYIRFKKDNPGNPDAVYPEANFYFMKKVYAKVPPIIEPSLKGKPHPNSFRILAHSYERLGLLADSKRIWLRYIELAPTDEAAKRNLERVENKLKGQAPPPPPKR